MKKGDTIRFKAISDLTGQELELTGTIEGGLKEIIAIDPESFGGLNDEAEIYLVVRQDEFGNTLRYVVHPKEIISKEGENEL